MEPATSIIKKFGGGSRVAEICGVSVSSPSMWQAPREKFGTGGTIPAKHIPSLIAYAKAHDVDVSLEDFFPDQSSSDMTGDAA